MYEIEHIRSLFRSKKIVRRMSLSVAAFILLSEFAAMYVFFDTLKVFPSLSEPAVVRFTLLPWSYAIHSILTVIWVVGFRWSLYFFMAFEISYQVIQVSLDVDFGYSLPEMLGFVSILILSIAQGDRYLLPWRNLD